MIAARGRFYSLRAEIFLSRKISPNKSPRRAGLHRRAPCIGAEQRSDGTRGRDLLKCLAWAGTGIVWTVAGGVPRSDSTSAARRWRPRPAASAFVQISDSHIGFKAEANPDPNATLQAALDKIAALPNKPAMMIHTGDVTHLSKAGGVRHRRPDHQGRQARHPLRPRRARRDRRRRQAVFRRASAQGRDARRLVQLRPGRGAFRRADQRAGLRARPPAARSATSRSTWLEKDLKGKTASTPIVVMAHMPLWPIYAQWGWATEDADAGDGPPEARSAR